MAKRNSGMVFSTNPELMHTMETQLRTPEVETILPKEQKLRVVIDRKMRKGKVVTLVEGFVGRECDLEDLGKKLKTTCGVGGSVKDGVIIIQGDQADKVVSNLQSWGYVLVRRK